MLSELVDRLVELGQSSREAKIIACDREPKNAYYLQNADGEVDLRYANAPLRAHVASDLDTLAALTRKFASETIVIGGEVDRHEAVNKPVVWYSRAGVELVVDDLDRWDRVTMPLQLTPQVIALQNLEKPKTFDQKSLVFLLRTTFKDCLGPAGSLVEVLRGIKWVNNAQGESVAGHGRVSVGKSIEQSITGTAALPEYVNLSVPIFVGLPPRYQVQLALEPDTATQSFAFLPLPLEIERAISMGEAWIGDELERMLLGDDEVTPVAPVYYGRP